MREILFRVKTLTNRWVYGSYYKQEEFYGNKEDADVIISSTESLTYDQALEYAIVIPETIGQYTGLTDKNGKKIFEGDIVKHYNNSDERFDIGVIYWDEKFSQLKRTSIGNFHHSSFTYSISRSCDYEIIGNIHDNPGLLKGGEG